MVPAGFLDDGEGGTSIDQWRLATYDGEQWVDLADGISRDEYLLVSVTEQRLFLTVDELDHDHDELVGVLLSYLGLDTRTAARTTTAAR